MKELNTIQTKLHAPKGLKNEFAGFQYRNAEGILKAVKPLLAETGCTLTLTDDLVLVGNRYYTKATAILTNANRESVSTTGFAREAEEKRGNDVAQISGACSSYARKYALCGLFAIDDSSQDPDSTENTRKRALAEVEACTSVAELKAVCDTFRAQLKGDKEFVRAVNEKNVELNKEN